MFKKYSLGFIFLFLMVPLSFLPLVSASNIPVDNDYSFNHLTSVKVAMYNGSGAWNYGKIAFPRFLDWAGCTYANVSGQDIIDGCLEDFDILYWPGGDYVAYWGEMGAEGKQAVQEFISNGGGYLGICAGAYYACDYMVWMDDGNFPPPDYKVEGDDLNLDLIDAVAWGPIFEIADRPEPGCAMTQIDIVDHTHPVSRDLPDTMQIIYCGGPYFEPNEGAQISIIGKYNLIDKIAITANAYGEGRVFLISPHPEIEEDTDRDGFEPFSEYEDEGSDWPLIYNAIEWLAFLSSSTNTQGAPFSTVFTITAVIILVYWSRRDKKNRRLSN